MKATKSKVPKEVRAALINMSDEADSLAATKLRHSDNDIDDYERRVTAYENEGLSRSDAQGVVDAEDLQRERALGRISE